MKNERIRQAAKAAHVPLWKLAERLNVSEATMTRMLRRDLTQEKEEKILALIAGEGGCHD